MNPYDGPDEGGFGRDGDFDPDMITMKPPRWQRWRAGRPVAVAGVAVMALAGGAGVGFAATHSFTSKAADTAALSQAAASPSPSASAPAAPGPGKGQWHAYGGGFPGGPGRFMMIGGLGLGGGMIHGQFTVPKSGGGYQTVDVQQGTVTSVGTTSVTVKSSDGFTATYAVSSNTVVDAQAAGIGSVKKGDTIFVTATVSGSTATAANIMDLTRVKAGRASFGFQVPVHPKMAPPAAPAPNA